MYMIKPELCAPGGGFSYDHGTNRLVEMDPTVHVLVPVPSSFTKSGGWRRITVALAYDPPVRPTRLDYLASRMDFWAFRDVTVEQVRNAYAAPLEDTNTVPATLTDLRLELQPSTTLRSPDANQWASRTFPQLFKGGQRELVIVVRNTNRWDGDGNKQHYALAVVLERDPRQSALYAELRAQFELLLGHVLTHEVWHGVEVEHTTKDSQNVRGCLKNVLLGLRSALQPKRQLSRHQMGGTEQPVWVAALLAVPQLRLDVRPVGLRGKRLQEHAATPPDVDRQAFEQHLHLRPHLDADVEPDIIAAGQPDGDAELEGVRSDRGTSLHTAAHRARVPAHPVERVPDLGPLRQAGTTPPGRPGRSTYRHRCGRSARSAGRAAAPRPGTT